MTYKTMTANVLQQICADESLLKQICDELETTEPNTSMQYCGEENDRRVYELTTNSDGHNMAVMFRGIIDGYKKNKERLRSAN